MEKKQFDITKFPEGPQEIIKYMDYMPDDDAQRMGLLMTYMWLLIQQ